MEEKLPPGFRFHPTDEELITYYLSRKISDSLFTSRAISVVDLNKCEPWDLPAKATMGEKEWYFFSLRDRKYPTGLRTNRATEAGYWKTTGKDMEIFRGDALVGMKKTLVFYRGRAPKGEKSNWVMHEYRLDAKLAFKPAKDEWVVCRVFKKAAIAKRPPQSPSSQPPLGSPSDTNANSNEFGDLDLTNLNHVSNIANSSSTYSGIQLHNNSYNPGMDSFNGDMDMNMPMNWAARQVASSLASPFSWPSNSLNPNLSTNLVLLKALQLGGFQAREAMSLAGFPPLTQQHQSLGNAFGAGYNPNPIGSSSSSSKVILDSSQQQQQHQQEQQEQPYNWTPYDEHA